MASLLWSVALLTTVVISAIDGQPSSGGQCAHSTSKRFASKTAYRNAGTPTRSDHLQIPGCKALQVYGIYRHGTRYPSVSDVSDMIERVPTLRDVIVRARDNGNSSLCASDQALLKAWKITFNGSMSNTLHEEGQREANAIAKRLRNRFNELFTQSYSPNVYQFRTTDTKRTQDTAKAFSRGLFDTDEGVKMLTKENEELLRFYKSCQRWESEVDDNETAVDEYFRFIHSPQVAEAGERMAQRLGLNRPISFFNMSILWEMCRFETAWNIYPNGDSPWCNLFSDEDLSIMEYSEDVVYYWKEGYGHPINYEQACPILVDLFKNFKAFKDPSASGSHPSALFHFTHSGLLLKLYARLGLFNDSKPLLADDYHINGGRQWATSTIDPFGSNIAFVLYNCTDDGAPGGVLKVMTLVQEREVNLKNCTAPLCPLDTLLATYGSYADNCDLNRICKANSSAVNAVSFYLITMALALFAYNLM